MAEATNPPLLTLSPNHATGRRRSSVASYAGKAVDPTGSGGKQRRSSAVPASAVTPVSDEDSMLLHMRRGWDEAGAVAEVSSRG